MRFRQFVSYCALLAGCIRFALPSDFGVKVIGGDGARENALVTASCPADFPEHGHLWNGDTPTPFQKRGNQILFRVERILPRQQFDYRVVPHSTPDAMTAELANGTIVISQAGKKLFVYQGQESQLPRPDIKPIFKRGGYIHPVYTPSGKIVTDDYPPNHLHHHGIWFPWTKTSFEGREPDFWNMGDGKGRVEFVKFGEHWSGPVDAGFTTYHRFVDLTSGEPKPALDEVWQVTGYAMPGGLNIFDLVSTQSCATASLLKLEKYYYGGLGFRGPFAWNGSTNAFWLSSNGETNRVKGNETRGNWCHVSGLVDGQLAGIAVLCHPDNFRAPQPMRMHPNEPFLCFAPSQLGEFTIEPGRAYVSRYRFVVSDGPPKKELLDTLWEDYAHPLRAEVLMKSKD